MSRRSLSHLSRQALLSGLDEAESRQRSGDADVLAHLGEVGYRRLYAQLGYSSLFTWCVHARHYSEGVAVKRIRAARALSAAGRADGGAGGAGDQFLTGAGAGKELGGGCGVARPAAAPALPG